SRLADRDVLVLEVADLADGGAALDADEALLAPLQLLERVLAFLCHQVRRAAGAPHHLPALAGAELDVVDHRAEGDRTQRQAVTRADVRLGSRHHAIADAQPDRREDVALLAVDVVEERQARRAVRIVLDGSNARGDVLLVAAEVDDPVAPLVAAAAMAQRDAAVVVAPAALADRRHERRLRTIAGDLREIEAAAEAAPGRGRLVEDRRHRVTPARRNRCAGLRRASRRLSSNSAVDPRRAPLGESSRESCWYAPSAPSP